MDAFIRTRLKQVDLDSRESGPNTWQRLLTFVLTGMPSTRRQVEDFTGEENPISCKAIVNRLLESKHSGERRLRQWMDLMQYTDSHGSEGAPTISHAYQYGDYVDPRFRCGRFPEVIDPTPNDAAVKDDSHLPKV